MSKDKGGRARHRTPSSTPETRMGGPAGRRSMMVGGSGRRAYEAAYQAASQSALIPNVPDIGPIDATVYQRRLMWLARHLYRNDPWIRALAETWTAYVYGTGPVPRSRHNRLADLFMMSAAKFDSRGVAGWGRLLREDIGRNRFIDGEVFARVTLDEDADDGILVPSRWQTLTSDYCPPELIRGENGGASFTVAGIQFAVGPDGRRTDRREGYWFYPSHPRDVYVGSQTQWTPEFVAASEVRHAFSGPTGCPRGEVPIAAAILRALKLATYEDAELRRKITATFMSLFVTRPLDAMDDEKLFPSAEEINDLLDQIQLQPAGIWQLPAGYQADLKTPPDSPGNLIASVRWHLYAICASVGVPVHLVTGNHDGLSDRTERFAGLDFKRRIECTRADDEASILNPGWCDFVDHALVTGRFVLPAGTPAWELYQVEWDWPIIQLNNLSTDINAFVSGINAGIVDKSFVTQNLFGVRHETVTRSNARAAAREQALGFEKPEAGDASGGAAGGAGGGAAGASPRWNPDATPIARSVMDQVTAEEQAERDLVDSAFVADAFLDSYEPAVDA